MGKITAAFNMTLDGNCDHTAGLPDEEIHRHYTDLLTQGDVVLYGRTTYQLMEFWRPFVENPSPERSMNEFAIAINKIPKIVFSHRLSDVDWKTASIANSTLQQTVSELRQQPGKNVLVCSRSLIIQLMKLNLLDELQLCVYPVVAGKGLTLFDDTIERTLLNLVKTKTFNSGAIVLYYQLNG